MDANRNNEDDNDSILGEVTDESRELNNPDTFNLNRILSMLLAENRGRDEMFKRVMDSMIGQQTRPSNNVQMIPDFQKNVPKFDGQKDAREWLDKITSMKTLHQWPDTYVLETARSHLEKRAYRWWLAKKEEIDTFDQFKTSFKKTFIHDEGLPEKWKRMNEIIQQRGEGIHDYFHEKVRLCKDLNLSTSDSRKQVLIGLYHKDMCNTMMAKQHTNLDDLLHNMNEYIQVEEARLQDEIRENIKQEQGKMKERFDKRRYQGIKYELGDVVVMMRAPEVTGESTKTQAKYKGPLVISKIFPHDTYQVTTLNKNKGGHILTTNAHVSQLKLYKNSDESESDEEEDESDGEEILYEEPEGNDKDKDNSD